ncbi:MAG: PTS sugar transporter subunit IIB [Firmicutes bacterium]|nr:PTS sugar transporter subunit IIB [Bacillota bacterium]
MRELKVVTVCGVGMGSSLILRMNTEKALRELGVAGKVDAIDSGQAKGVGQRADIVVTFSHLAKSLNLGGCRVVSIVNVMDKESLKKNLAAAIEEIKESEGQR